MSTNVLGMFNGHISLIYSVYFTDIVSYPARRQLTLTAALPSSSSKATNRDFLQQRNVGSKAGNFEWRKFSLFVSSRLFHHRLV